MIRSPGPSVVTCQYVSLLHSLEESKEPDNGVYKSMPGHHKRPACVLDEEDEGEESEEGIEDTEEGGVLSAAGPYTKRSKVDVRYV
jgi:hypothetical protein